MNRISKRLALGIALGCLLALLAACGETKPQALLFNEAPWQSGEQSTYAITDQGGKSAGYLTYTITDGTNDLGQRMWVIEREVNSLGDREVATAKVSENGFRPSASYLERSSDGATESVDAQYSGAQVDLVLSTRQQNVTNQRVPIPSDAREYVTLPMIVRALPLAKGYATQLNSFLPVAALLDRVTVRVVGEDQVTVPAGDYASWVVDLRIGDADTKAWINKTAPHELVKLYDARTRATYELTEFAPGE